MMSHQFTWRSRGIPEKEIWERESAYQDQHNLGLLK